MKIKDIELHEFFMWRLYNARMADEKCEKCSHAKHSTKCPQCNCEN